VFEVRPPQASINFVTCHDGFTLRDLVTYNDKHNDLNGEGGRDGHDANRSWNCGVEGETDDPEILALRLKQRRNLVATLLLSQGLPMLLAGDELGQTQHGNNNAYCQDNDASWTDWDLSADDRAFLEFTCRVVHLVRREPVLHRRHFFQGRRIRGSEVSDIMWLAPDGREMTDAEWNAGHVKCLGVRLAGGGIGEVDDMGRPVVGDTLVYVLNAGAEAVPFILPGFEPGLAWHCLIDTFDGAREGGAFASGQAFALGDRSVAVFKGIRSRDDV